MGMLSFSEDEYAVHVTVRGESVEILQEGLYKYNFKAMVGEGIAWDAVGLIIFTLLDLVGVVFLYLVMKNIKPTKMRFTGRL